MNPALLVLLAGIVMNGLAMLGMWFAGHPEWIMSLLAGAILPVLISCALLYVGSRQKGRDGVYFQKLNIIGFGVKILLIGGWAALLLGSENLHNMTFIVTLLTNFLAWHMTEAYHWPLLTGREELNEGD